MTASGNPRVTIGLPVYNGADQVHIAVEAVLAQTDGDLQLLISDNCSTDGTGEVCRAYAREDSRVVYTRLPANIGAAGNYCHLVKIADSEFFRWISHDDRIEPTFVAECVAAASSDPTIITVAPVMELVSGSGEHIMNVAGYVHPGQWSSDRLTQYRQMMDELAYCETHNDGFMMIAYEYGLHRLALLRKTRLVMPYISSDYVFAAELALFGRLFKLDTTLSQFALSGGTTSNFGTWNPVAIQQMQAPGHTSALDIAISTRRRHIEHVRAVVRSPLSVKDKLLAVPAATRPQRSRLEKRIRRRLGMAVE